MSEILSFWEDFGVNNKHNSPRNPNLIGLQMENVAQRKSGGAIEYDLNKSSSQSFLFATIRDITFMSSPLIAYTIIMQSA
jgi:hypothetical protein